MDQKTLDDKGWNPDPFDGLKILKGEMDYYYDSDPEIQKSEEKIQYWIYLCFQMLFLKP